MSTPVEPTARVALLNNAHKLTQRLLDVSSPHGSESPSHRVDNAPGYTTPIFKGKEEQRALVESDVAAKVICALFCHHHNFLTNYAV